MAEDEERTQANQDVSKQIRQIFGKMQDFDASQLNLEQDLSTIRCELRNKCNVGRIEQVECALADFATKTEFNKILNRLESYTSLESFNKSRISQEKHNTDAKLKMDLLASKTNLAYEVELMKEFVSESIKSNSQKRDCAKDKREFQAAIEKLSKELLDLRDEHRNSKERIRILETVITNKVEKQDFSELKAHIELLPTKEEVLKLRQFMKESVDNFKGDNEMFHKEFANHLAIIRRYDEVISEKASKHSIFQLEAKVNEMYRPMLKEHDDRIKTNRQLIKE